MKKILIYLIISTFIISAVACEQTAQQETAEETAVTQEYQAPTGFPKRPPMTDPSSAVIVCVAIRRSAFWE